MAGSKVQCEDCGCRVNPSFHSRRTCRRFARVTELYRHPEGFTLAEIGRQVGVTRERIRQIGKLAGLETARVTDRNHGALAKVRCAQCGCMVNPRRHPQLECQHCAQIVELWNRPENLTLAEITRRLGLDYQRVLRIAQVAEIDTARTRKRCTSCGCAVAPRFHPQRLCERYARVLELYNLPERPSLSEIGRRVGIWAQGVKRIVRKAGLDLPSAQELKHGGLQGSFVLRDSAAFQSRM